MVTADSAWRHGVPSSLGDESAVQYRIYIPVSDAAGRRRGRIYRSASRLYRIRSSLDHSGCPVPVLLALLLVFAKKELVDTPIEAYDYAIDQYQYAGGYDGYVTSYDQNYVQTFTTDKPF